MDEGLGACAMAERAALRAILGARLKPCGGLVDSVQSRSAHEIFGHPDDLKSRSSLTMFAARRLKRRLCSGAA